MNIADFFINIGVHDTGAVRALRQINASAEGAKKSISGFASDAGSKLAALGSLIAGSMAVHKIIQTSDAMAGLKARMNDAFNSAENGNAAFEDSFNRAQKLGVSFENFGSAVARLAPAYTELGKSPQEAINSIETLTTLLKLSGASTEEASSTMIQFAQAMGSGKLAGDEFRAMSESSPAFMRLLAEEMGVTIGQLKELGSNGKLTADVISKTLAKSYDKISEKSKNLPKTFGTSFAKMGNAFAKLMSKIEQSGAFQILLTNIDDISQKILEFANDSTKVESLTSSIKDAINAFVQFAPIVLSLVASFYAFNATTGLLRGGLSLVTGAMSMFNAILLANPVTLVVVAIAALIAIVVGAYAYSEKLRNAVGNLWNALGRLASSFGITKSAGEIFKGVMGAIGDAVSGVVDKIAAGVNAIADFVTAVRSMKAPSWLGGSGGAWFSSGSASPTSSTAQSGSKGFAPTASNSYTNNITVNAPNASSPSRIASLVGREISGAGRMA